jgi:hypothetical protein
MKNLPKINLVWDALHVMAYYIFLKSLRCLEEFRKNPHVKIPPKFPSTNFQSLDKLKIQFLIQKFFFLISARPTWPLAQPTHWPRRPRRPKPSLAGPSNPCVSHVFTRNTSSLLIRGIGAGRLSLVSLTTRPQLSAPTPTSSHPSSPVLPPLPGHRAPPSSTPRVPPDRYHLTFISPPLNPLLNPPPSSMALKPLTPA